MGRNGTAFDVSHARIAKKSGSAETVLKYEIFGANANSGRCHVGSGIIGGLGGHGHRSSANETRERVAIDFTTARLAGRLAHHIVRDAIAIDLVEIRTACNYSMIAGRHIGQSPEQVKFIC